MAKPIVSKFSVIDANQNNIVSYVCYDNTVDEVEYVIYDNASGNIIADKTVQTSGASSVRTFTIPAGTIKNRLLPYYIKMCVHNQSGDVSELSDAVLFYCHSRPSIYFRDVNNFLAVSISFPAYSFDAVYEYVEDEAETLTRYKYILYDENKNVLNENVYYGDLTQSFLVTGLDNNTSYFVRAIGETVNGYVVDTGYCPIAISYTSNQDDLTISAENEKQDGRIKISVSMKYDPKNQYDMLRIKRRIVGTYKWTTLFEKNIKGETDDVTAVFYDKYARGRGAKYQYSVVPVVDDIEQEGVSTEVESSFGGAYLVDKDTTYYIGLDAKVSSVERIQNSSVETTLSSEYPIVFYGSKTNYYSGNFSGTIIKYDRSNDYFDFDASVDYREQYINWLTNQKPKVLKMWDGRIWLINVTDNISYSDDDHPDKVEISFNFVETGDTTNTNNLKDADLI